MTRFYRPDHLDVIIDAIGKDTNLRFIYDKDHLQHLRDMNQEATIQRQTVEHQKVVGNGPIKRDFTLVGEVVDKSTAERIPYAMITINGTSTGAMTDANGRFTLTRVPADTCTLKLLPNLGEKDILRGFQLIPGVSASNEISSGMYVRGGTPDQNLILYDGFTIYYVDHMHGFYSAFNSNAIKDVQLYKGGYEAKYGGRLSSVTEITAKDGNRNKFTVGGEVSLLSMNAYAEIPVRTLSRATDCYPETSSDG